MTKIFVLCSIGFALLISAVCDDAHGQGRPSPAGNLRRDTSTLNADTGGAGSAQSMSASQEKTCTKFLPNVGLVMIVPCSDPPPEISLQVAAIPAIAATAKPTQPSAWLATAPEKANYRLSRKACSEILQRIQLDDVRNGDREQLRNGC